ncbi:MAG: EF-hand domain-containing protein [Asticcacaulis sp.]|nr:EF-hand domain-containing protein [Asticcacaulis sp.]
MNISALSGMSSNWPTMTARTQGQAGPPPGSTDGGGFTGQAIAFSENSGYFQSAMTSGTMGGLLAAQGADGGFAPPSFSDIDSDGDGSISETEFESFDAGLQTHGPGSPPLSKQADETADNDAASSTDGLTKLMQQLLAALDAYKSGAAGTTTASQATTTTSIAA